MVDHFNKLVRDNIPEIIASQGDIPKVEIFSNERFYSALNQKLVEEVNEYLEGHDIEELADIVEVVLALVTYQGISPNAFEKIRLQKRIECGGFNKRICLVEVNRKQAGKSESAVPQA